jgi:hypothetical protein
MGQNNYIIRIVKVQILLGSVPIWIVTDLDVKFFLIRITVN